jgi:hypothetical protein
MKRTTLRTELMAKKKIKEGEEGKKKARSANFTSREDEYIANRLGVLLP